MSRRLVFDSDAGRVCATCGQPTRSCRCRADRAAERPAGDGVVRVRRELRKGKPIAVASGLAMTRDERKALVKKLKRRFGVGGTVTDEGFELQGDLRDAVVDELRGLGQKAVAAGG